LLFKHGFAIPHIFSFIKLDEFVVMPNHVHGIIIIDKPVNPDLPACRGAIYRDSGVNNCVSAINNRDSDINNCNSAINNRDSDINNRDSCDENALIDKGVAINRASTDGDTLKSPGGITGKKNPMLHDNLSRIIRWYKGRVAFESHQVDACFDWQPRFYDHIIRNEQEYLNISHYISNNPRNWREDKFFKK
jgi:REP element-mobilizing transposase RayT